MKQRFLKILAVIVVILLVFSFVWYACVHEDTGDVGDTEDATEVTETEDYEEDILLDVDFLNERNPEDFTWEEYHALTPEEQAVFPDYFDSYDEYIKWYDDVYEDISKYEEISINDDFLNGKYPEHFTWEEYQALTSEEQAMFPDCFYSLDEYKRWYESVQEDISNYEEISINDDFLNGRNPEDFTWEEYEALTTEEQAMFPDYFDSYDEYLQWMETAKS